MTAKADAGTCVRETPTHFWPWSAALFHRPLYLAAWSFGPCRSPPFERRITGYYVRSSKNRSPDAGNGLSCASDPSLSPDMWCHSEANPMQLCVPLIDFTR